MTRIEIATSCKVRQGARTRGRRMREKRRVTRMRERLEHELRVKNGLSLASVSYKWE